MVSLDDPLQRIMSNNSTHLSLSSENLNISRITQFDDSENVDKPCLRKAISLDSLRLVRTSAGNDNDSYREDSRSPTASSGIEGGSIKDYSPMQIDVIAGDSASIDTQEEVKYFKDKQPVSCYYYM
jgi:hypothetical protein